MNKKIIKYIISIAIIVIIISVITIVYSYTNRSEDIDIYEKIETEVSYIDRRVLQLMKMLNNLDTEALITNNVISINESGSEEESSTEETNKAEDGNEKAENKKQEDTITISTAEPKSVLTIDRNEVDWEYIKTELENLISSWAVITIDLKSVNVDSDDILEFNNYAESALKYAQNKNKVNVLISLSNLYGLLPKYSEQCNIDSNKLEIMYIKYNVLAAYALIDTNQWEHMYGFLGDADNRSLGLVNLVDDQLNKQNIQKSYVLLKEFIKSANEKDVELCYMKFYYLIDELERN